MAIQIFLPTISLAGTPADRALRKIKNAGFDGAEMVVSSHNRGQANQIRELANKYGLGLRWHQSWSLAENRTHWYNVVANWLGMLEPKGYSLSDILPKNQIEPIVVYADRWQETLDRPLALLQTCSVMNGEGKRALSLDQFKRIAREYQPRLVFDTQHYLEWHFDCVGVGDLPTDRGELEAALWEGWQEFHHLVEEIHCNDFDPKRGHSRGRNLFPGDGVAPLESFAVMVLQTGWEGVVVPEVSPLNFFPYRNSTMRHLYEDVSGLFDL
ncbi:MAG TPA: TIM barrel protein [Patescibacteria group bacterium]|nr:TIM barrel protein [Patescibacteria group bacterium]